MDLKIYFHGILTGQKSWNVEEEDKPYIDTCYVEQKEDVIFSIQTLRRESKVYCYYNYLVNRNVVMCSDDRALGYFGITLRMDYYCVRPLDIFRILDTIFNLYIVGTGHIYEPFGKKFKPNISNFQEAESELTKAKDAIEKMLGDGPANNDFVSASKFPVSTNQYQLFNPIDCKDEQLNEAMRKFGYIKVSPQYPSNEIKKLEADYSAKAVAENKKMDDVMAQMRQADSRFNDAQSTIRKKEIEVEQKNAEIDELKKKLQEAGENKKLAQLIQPIKNPIQELAAAVKRISPSTVEESPSGTKYEQEKPKIKSNWFPSVSFINTLLLILIFIFLIVQGCSHKTEKPEAEKKEVVSEVYTNSKVVDADPYESDVESSTKEDFSTDGYKIDVSGYNGKGSLKQNRLYGVSIKHNGAKEDPSGVEWDFKNATFNPDSTFMPTADHVVITLIIDGKEVCQRTIPVDLI